MMPLHSQRRAFMATQKARALMTAQSCLSVRIPNTMMHNPSHNYL